MRGRKSVKPRGEKVRNMREKMMANVRGQKGRKCEGKKMVGNVRVGKNVENVRGEKSRKCVGEKTGKARRKRWEMGGNMGVKHKGKMAGNMRPKMMGKFEGTEGREA